MRLDPRRRPWPLLLLLAQLLFPLGASRTAARSDPGTGEGPLHAGELFRYVLVRTLDTAEGTGGMLYQPGRFLLADDGRYYVEDHGDRRIAVFDSSGRFSHAFGGSGGGPGEFASLRIQEVSDGVVSVFDQQGRRTTRFTTEGELLEVKTIPPQHPSTVTGFHRLGPDRWLLLGKSDHSSSPSPTTEQARIIFVDPDDRQRRVKVFDPVRVAYLGVMESSGRSRSRPFFYHFGPRPLLRFHRGTGILYAPSDAPVIEVYGMYGEPRSRIHVDVASSQVSSREKQQVEEWMERLAENNPALANMFTSERRSLEFPAYKAYWADLQVDSSGHLWLQRPTMRFNEIHPDREADRHRIVSPEGRYLGDTQWPVVGVGMVSRGHLCMNYKEPVSGRRILAVYRIVPAVEGLTYP